jgi:hypothetical protein
MTLKRIKANMKPGTVGWTYAPDGVPMVLVCEPTNKNVKKFTSITDYAFPNTARRGAKRQAARLGFKYMGCLHDA